jgi:hypothetical protein
MPVLWADDARAELGDERFEDALLDPRSLDLLTWDLFRSLETHADQNWLAYRLQALGGTALTAPVSIQLWTGRTTEPLLHPSRASLAAVRERARQAGADDADLARFAEPIEVPVRIESPGVLCLVDTVLDTPAGGTGGRDRLLELVDAGLEHARHLSKQLAVAVVYQGGTAAAKQMSARVDQLRRTLPAELPHQPAARDVQLRDLSWQQLVKMWEAELDYLAVPGSPRALLAHLDAVGLR